MGMKKKKRKKRQNPSSRKVRLPIAEEWALAYEGKFIVRDYAKHFKVDKVCALTELEMLGHTFSDDFKEQLKKGQQQSQNSAQGHKRHTQDDYSLTTKNHEHFAFIVGYTSEGEPIGITWDQWDKIEPPKADSLSDEEYYSDLLQEDINQSPTSTRELDGINIMILEPEADIIPEPAPFNQREDLHQLFEFFIQWKAGNLSEDKLRSLLG